MKRDMNGPHEMREHELFTARHYESQVYSILDSEWKVPFEQIPVEMRMVFNTDQDVFFSEICTIKYTTGWVDPSKNLVYEWEGLIIMNTEGFVFKDKAENENVVLVPWDQVSVHEYMAMGWSCNIRYGGYHSFILKQEKIRGSHERNMLRNNLNIAYLLPIILYKKEEKLEYLLNNKHNRSIYDKKLVKKLKSDISIAGKELKASQKRVQKFQNKVESQGPVKKMQPRYSNITESKEDLSFTICPQCNKGTLCPGFTTTSNGSESTSYKVYICDECHFQIRR